MLQRLWLADLTQPAAECRRRMQGRRWRHASRHRLPVLLGRPGRRPGPRARPGRDADRARPRGVACSPRPTTTTPLPAYVVPAGRAVPVPYNGSVARLNFGLLSAGRVRRWLREGGFDVLHVHEPAAPEPVAAGLLGRGRADRGHLPHLEHRGPGRMAAAYPILQPALEKISARIAVSEDGRARPWSSTSAATRC